MPQTRLGILTFVALLLILVVSFAAPPAQASDHCDAGYEACMGETDDLIEEMDCFSGLLACQGY